MYDYDSEINKFREQLQRLKELRRVETEPVVTAPLVRQIHDLKRKRELQEKEREEGEERDENGELIWRCGRCGMKKRYGDACACSGYSETG